MNAFTTAVDWLIRPLRNISEMWSDRTLRQAERTLEKEQRDRAEQYRILLEQLENAQAYEIKRHQRKIQNITCH